MSLEEFDTQVKNAVDSGKLSSTKIKAITELAIQNVQEDAHLVSTLFRVHKKAKPANKIWSFYVIDAISREMKSHAKKGKGKEGTGKGTSTSFLSKMEICLERLVTESLDKGLPEHREKIKKVLGIWNTTSTFKSELLVKLLAQANKDSSSSSSSAPKARVESPVPPVPSTILPTSATSTSTSAVPLSSDLLSALTGQSTSAPPAPAISAPQDLAAIIAALNPTAASAIPPPPPPAPVEAPNTAAIGLLLQQLASAQGGSPLPGAQGNNPGGFQQQHQQHQQHPGNNGRSPPRQNWNNQRGRGASPPVAREAIPLPRRPSPVPDGRIPPPRNYNASPPSRRAPLPDPPIQRFNNNNYNQEQQNFQPIGTFESSRRDSPPPFRRSQPQPQPDTMAITYEGPTFLDPDNPDNPPDFSSFNALEPLSWEKFARTWLWIYDFVPTNTQLMMTVQNFMMMAANGGANQGGEEGDYQEANDYNNEAQAEAPPAGKKRGQMKKQADGSYKFEFS